MEEKLRKLMKHEGLNSTRLAEIMGIQASGISHIMSGRNKPSYDFLIKLLQRFPQINPDWLLLDKGPMYRDEVKNKTVTDTSVIPSVVNSALSKTAAVSEGLFSAPAVPGASGRDDEDIIPSGKPVVQTPAPVQAPPSTGFSPSSSIERIVVFYKDKTFSEYQPE